MKRKSKKTYKAWATICKTGEICRTSDGLLEVYTSETYGGMEPCTITYDDGKKKKARRPSNEK